mgnify:CR=1 FL=1
MKCISPNALRRLPVYLSYLKQLPDRSGNISATAIAGGLGLGDVQVRKDLAGISGEGKPKTGYNIQNLIDALETVLGYKSVTNAVIIGAGRLGTALMEYPEFKEYGLHILAAFDIDPERCSSTPGKPPVYPLSQLAVFCRDNAVKIGIITVPADQAQSVCDRLVENSIHAIWNFAPVHLHAKAGVTVQNENMAASIALLSNHLS